MTRLFIAIACHNRRRIAEECLPTVAAGMDPKRDYLTLFNDGSTEYDADWLQSLVPIATVVSSPAPSGIQAQRRAHLELFLKSDATHLYLTDHDMIHDPEWRGAAFGLAATYDAPVCLYNTAAHADLKGNTFKDDPDEDVIRRHYAPGCSYFLCRKDVERIREFIPQLAHFDWQIPALLRYSFVTSRMSWCDHIGFGGERHPKGAGYDEGDRALNPTQWLQRKRAQVVAALQASKTPATITP